MRNKTNSDSMTSREREQIIGGCGPIRNNKPEIYCKVFRWQTKNTIRMALGYHERKQRDNKLIYSIVYAHQLSLIRHGVAHLTCTLV